MAKTIMVVGYGPGVSSAVAERFGREGFAVALVARSEDRLAAGVEALKASGVKAAAFVGDARQPEAIADVIRRASGTLGPIGVLHWNAYGGAEAGDLMTTDPATVGAVFDVAVVGLLAAVQAALPDLKATANGAVLITNGAFGDITPEMDRYAVSLNSMGVALANAAKHKLTGLLSARLDAEGVYVGEVTIAGMVKGTPWAQGGGGIEPSKIADTFWELYRGRGVVRARVS